MQYTRIPNSKKTCFINEFTQYVYAKLFQRNEDTNKFSFVINTTEIVVYILIIFIALFCHGTSSKKHLLAMWGIEPVSGVSPRNS